MNDSDEKIVKPCLILPEIPVNFDPNSVPTSGEEYLMHMAYERKQLPAVSFIPGHKSGESMGSDSQDPRKPKSLPPHSPNTQWKLCQIDDFKRMRNKIERLREKLGANGFNVESMTLPLTENEEDWKLFVQENPPLISTIIRINQQSLELLLEFIVKWLKTTPIHGDENKWLGSWLYSICACLSFPFDACVYSVLRAIAKSCIEYRNGFSKDQSMEAIPYNLIILIVANVFGQMDLNEAL